MAKRETIVAKQYARALFEAVQPSELDALERALTVFVNAWNERDELRSALKNPAVPVAERISAVGDLADLIVRVAPSGEGNTGLNPSAFKNFLSVLMENNRLDVAPQILESFSAQLAALKKILAVSIESAFALSANEQEELSTKLTGQFGSLAKVAWTVNEELIGGLRIRSGDKLLDGSVDGALRRLEQELSLN